MLGESGGGDLALPRRRLGFLWPNTGAAGAGRKFAVLGGLGGRIQTRRMLPSATSVFEARTVVEASQETLFAFHAEPRNLTVVMPPTLKLVELITDGPAAEGRLIEIHCRDWGVIPMRWLCRWREVVFPRLLVDEMLRGPFRIFVHEHHFTDLGGGRTELRDRVTYAFGRGWWGRVISEVGVRLYLVALFAYRHHRTRRWAARQGGG